jgi:hypothetical protein
VSPEGGRTLLTHSVFGTGTTTVGRMLSEDRKRMREEGGAPTAVPSLATGTQTGRRPGRGEVDIPRQFITAHLMRNISVMSDGWKYRKETKDFKIYLPKRPKLSQVVRDKQLILAIMAQFPDKLKRLNSFNEFIKSTSELAASDPYPLALKFLDVESIELPDIETLAYDNKAEASKEDGEGDAVEEEAEEEAEWSEEPSEGEEDDATDVLLVNQAGGSIRKHNRRFRTNFTYGRNVYDMPWRATMRDAARDWWILRTVVDALETPVDKRNFITIYRKMTGRIVIPEAVTDTAVRQRIRKFMMAQLNTYVKASSEPEEDIEMKGDEESMEVDE